MGGASANALLNSKLITLELYENEKKNVVNRLAQSSKSARYTVSRLKLKALEIIFFPNGF